MLIGHLTFAGLAELVLSGGLVAYLQRADPALLRATAPGSPTPAHRHPAAGGRSGRCGSGWRVLMTATPLGSAGGRHRLGRMGGGGFPRPAGPPADCRRVGSGRTAGRGAARSGTPRVPVDRADAGLRAAVPQEAGISGTSSRRCSASVCAADVAGGGLVRRRVPAQPPSSGDPRLSTNAGFLERNVAALAGTLDDAARADDTARRGGLAARAGPTRQDRRISRCSSWQRGRARLAVIGAFFALAVTLAALSRVPWRARCCGYGSGVLAFTGSIALPAVFLTPGPALLVLPGLRWTVTAHGLLAAHELVARAETTATLRCRAGADDAVGPSAQSLARPAGADGWRW